MTDAVIDAIGRDEPPALESSRERCIHEVAIALLHEPPVSQELYQRAVAMLGHRLIVELIGLLGLYRATAYTMKFYDVPAPSSAPGSGGGL